MENVFHLLLSFLSFSLYPVYYIAGKEKEKEKEKEKRREFYELLSWLLFVIYLPLEVFAFMTGRELFP